MPELYDLCFAWNWDYDNDFAQILSAACQAQHLNLFQVTPENLYSFLDDLSARRLTFRALFDRASDSDERFTQVVDWARQHEVVRVNPLRLARKAWDKAAMHRKYAQAGLNVPPAIILPPFATDPELSRPHLEALGSTFVIKPAHGGGGRGVITGATTWEQVLAARQEFPQDQYLVQGQVSPARLGERYAWFRVIYCTGMVYPCWWDPCSHIYSPLSWTDEQLYGLGELHSILPSLAEICQLELFSTEIARTPEGEFVIVDYVNDPIDLRLQSKAQEGVPDALVTQIAEEIVSYIAGRLPVPVLPVYVYQASP